MKLPWRYILISLAIGMLLGAAAGIFYSRSIAAPWTPQSAERFLRRLDRELKLTEPQQTQIRSFLAGNRDRMSAYQEEVRKTTRAQIRGLLTPEQQPRFDTMVARHDAQRKKRNSEAKP